jgi:hypothetical protein
MLPRTRMPSVEASLSTASDRVSGKAERLFLGS